MLSRDRRSPADDDATTHDEASAATPAGKGRPTPTRREAEAARRRPLVPADRKAAAKTARAAQREQRQREYEAMLSGDERFLPLRDKGPVRRYVRDFVDGRRNLGEYFIPFSLVAVGAVLLVGFLDAEIAAVTTLVVIFVLYAMMLITVVDGFILSRQLRKRVAARFGEVPRGVVMYGVIRAFQIRSRRLPRPKVDRGRYPA
ncbi:DUF3043 domain-containing protein [Cellulomonas carbonis]|uniref:Membrane protein n=1 Tax=Cellulomonas carbonis T26 TaxID=947969 RepID=A0A0A0BPI4_9CELL|nr:DUF3043 domain-containing protein [Cellulomonas carbonis]KGM09865.1 membrane protein [Cellulomonas carbonis T26]GGB92930.1 hypothetical protein GCM10010972_01980 [Cellulomonas carbonis]